MALRLGDKEWLTEITNHKMFRKNHLESDSTVVLPSDLANLSLPNFLPGNLYEGAIKGLGGCLVYSRKSVLVKS